MAESPLKQRFVLDTSLFLTDEIRRGDEDVERACLRLLDSIAAAKLKLNISCYMPPSVEEELAESLGNLGVSEEVHAKLNTWVIKKSPSRLEVMVPAEIVLRFVEEVNERVDRGLRVSEDAVREAHEVEGGGAHDPGAAGDPAHGDPPDPEGMTEVDRVVSDLRDEYRRTLRRGILDSRGDFDLLVLARELEAGVVSEDRGVIAWADDFGLRYMRGREFPGLIEEYLDTYEAADGG